MSNVMFLVKVVCPTKSVRCRPRSQRQPASEVFAPQPAAGTCRGRAVWLRPHSSARAVRPASWRPANQRFGSMQMRIQVLCPLLPSTCDSRCFTVPPQAPAGRLPRRTEAVCRKAAEPQQKRGCASPPSWCTLAAVQKQQQTWSQSVFLSKRRNITIRSSGPPPAAAELKRYVSDERGQSYQVSPQ